MTVLSIFALYYDLIRQKKGNFIAYTECFSIDKDGVLNIDADSENLSEILKKHIDNYSKEHFTFKNELYKLTFFNIPKFLFPVLGLKNLKKMIEWKVNRGDYYGVLYIIRNVGNKNLQVEIHANKDKFNYTKTYEDVYNVIFLLIHSGVDYGRLIEVVSLFYLLIYGQSLLDMFLTFNKLDIVNGILASSREMLRQINRILKDSEVKDESEIHRCNNLWLSRLEFYEGFYHIHKNEPSDAIIYLMRALKHNMFHPYDNYEEFKTNYSRYEAAHVTENTKYFVHVDTKNEEDISSRINELSNRKDEILDSIKLRLPNLIDILKSILISNPTNEIAMLFETEFCDFEKDNKENAIMYIIKYELYKFVKKGEDKHGMMFIQRIPECIEYLNKCLEYDEDFGAVYAKLASMKLIKATAERNLNENVMKEMESLMDKSRIYYEKLGIKMYDK